MKLIVGTRGSRLSLAQTRVVIDQLTKKIKDLKIEVKIIKTTGDKMSKKPLLAINEKGIFEKEIDTAVMQGKVDFAVHSMKDVPVTQPFKTIIAAVPKRESPHDVLISNAGFVLKELPKNAVIGTGSPRRIAQLSSMRKDLQFKPIRGNVDTRINKVKQGLVDAIVLAEAGLNRLNMQDIISERLSIKDFIPAPGQGALSIVTKENNNNIIEILKNVNHSPSLIAQLTERAFVREMGGGCKIPLGAYAIMENNKISILACALSPDGKVKFEVNKIGDPKSPEELGKKAAQEILKKGNEILFEKWSDFLGKR